MYNTYYSSTVNEKVVCLPSPAPNYCSNKNPHDSNENAYDVYGNLNENAYDVYGNLNENAYDLYGNPNGENFFLLQIVIKPMFKFSASTATNNHESFWKCNQKKLEDYRGV